MRDRHDTIGMAVFEIRDLYEMQSMLDKQIFASLQRLHALNLTKLERENLKFFMNKSLKAVQKGLVQLDKEAKQRKAQEKTVNS